MYNSFFGFRERPFQLVPNPAYLYLSRSHEEAMAHMVYAISQGDGFVEITGEVGTGKTTLCRAVLENLDPRTKAAYIFNPKLDSLQLLKAINDEFGIDSGSDSIKELTDTLNAFLMKNRMEGNKVVLIIDEAQNLNKDVLEQLRLISNLETTTSKLIQIILVGQPELGEMLDSNELRQLGQRINLTCFLTPLSYKETKGYIAHRLQVASQKREVRFTGGALRVIYRHSGGIPRLINISCDRALLSAYGLNQKKITRSIAKASIRELTARGDVKRPSPLSRKGLPAFLAVPLVVFVAVLYLATLFVIIHESVDTKISALIETGAFERPVITQRVERAGPTDAGPATAERVPEKTGRKSGETAPELNAGERSEKQNREISPVAFFDLGSALAKVNRRSSRALAMKALIDLWAETPEHHSLLNDMEHDQDYFKVAARQNGLLIQRVEGELDALVRLNLPAVMEFYLEGGGTPRYLTIAKINERDALLLGGAAEEGVRVDRDQLNSYWSHVAYVAWKDFLNLPPLMSPQNSGDVVLTLKLFMQEIGYKGIEITPSYDEGTVKVIKQIQRKHGITTDGIVGPMTKIALYNEKVPLNVPRLAEE